jgi:hypothetical protein
VAAAAAAAEAAVVVQGGGRDFERTGLGDMRGLKKVLSGNIRDRVSWKAMVQMSVQH